MSYTAPVPPPPTFAAAVDPGQGVTSRMHPGGSSSRTGRLVAAVCGAASAVSLFVAVAAVDIPRGATDEEIVAWFRDGGNRTADVVSTFALLATGLFFLAFVSALGARIAMRSAAAARLAHSAGLVYVACVFTTGLGGAVVRGMVVNDEPTPGADVLRFFAQLRYTAMGVYALPSAAVVIGCFAWAALRDGALPRWLGWLGVVCVVAITGATALFVGQLAIPVLLVWTLAASFVLARSEIR